MITGPDLGPYESRDGLFLEDANVTLIAASIDHDAIAEEAIRRRDGYVYVTNLHEPTGVKRLWRINAGATLGASRDLTSRVDAIARRATGDRLEHANAIAERAGQR